MTSMDEAWMRKAMALALKGQGAVHPNPLVGCVIVRGGRVVGAGAHRAFGQAHAEVEALRRAGTRARGATLYVNLEPCSHWGKTPPCVDAVFRAGIRRVVAAMQDPNPRVSGRGFSDLRRHGIQVTRGVLQAEAQDLNRAFTTWVREGRSYVTLKTAASLDGKITTASGESRWITGPQARARSHRLRAQADAIAVGVETALQDNPSLTAHGRGRNPRRVIFDSRLRLPLRARVTDRAAPTWVFTTSKARAAKRAALEKKGLRIFVLPADRGGRVSLSEAARVLAREGVAHLLVEGGGTLHAGFLEAGLVDEVVWFLALRILGGTNAKTAVEGSGVRHLAAAWHLREIRVEQIGEDLCIQGKL